LIQKKFKSASRLSVYQNSTWFTVPLQDIGLIRGAAVPLQQSQLKKVSTVIFLFSKVI